MTGCAAWCSGVLLTGVAALVVSDRLLPARPLGSADGTAWSGVPSEASWASGADELPSVTFRWAEPPVEVRWAFDLFTPPPLTRDPLTRHWVLVPPVHAPAAAFEIELLAVLAPRARVQLVGYVGKRGDWIGVFEDSLTGETHLARVGQSVLGLQVASVHVQHKREAKAGTTPLSRWIATADLRDPDNGELLRLSDEVRSVDAPLQARFRSRTTQEVWEQKVGTESRVGDARVRLDGLRTDPTMAEIVYFPASDVEHGALHLVPLAE